MDRCKKEGIPIRILRVRDRDGKEILQYKTENYRSFIVISQTE